jgi:hypothetical protein
MSLMGGHERRPARRTAASRFLLSPERDRGRAALQYVAKGTKANIAGTSPMGRPGCVLWARSGLMQPRHHSIASLLFAQET